MFDTGTKSEITVSVKDCVALCGAPLLAVMVKTCAPSAAVAAIVMTPLELFMVTPEGAPVSVNATGAALVAVTWKVPPVPRITLVLLPLVITGGSGPRLMLSVTVLPFGSIVCGAGYCCATLPTA